PETAAVGGAQPQGHEQGYRTVGRQDRLAQSSAAQTEQLSATALAQAVHAKQLRALVWRFKLTDAGLDRTPAEAGPDAVLEAAPALPRAARGAGGRTRTLEARPRAQIGRAHV